MVWVVLCSPPLELGRGPMRVVLRWVPEARSRASYAFAKNEERNAGLEWETRGSFCLIEAYYSSPRERVDFTQPSR